MNHKRFARSIAKLKTPQPILGHATFRSIQVEALNLVAWYNDVRHARHILNKEPFWLCFCDASSIFANKLNTLPGWSTTACLGKILTGRAANDAGEFVTGRREVSDVLSPQNVTRTDNTKTGLPESSIKQTGP
jgi:hypothetical protein